MKTYNQRLLVINDFAQTDMILKGQVMSSL